MDGILLFISMLFLLTPAGEETGKLEAKITGLPSIEGKVAVMLYDQSGMELEEYWLTVESDEVTLSVDELPVGEYAIKLFHDANNNGKMDFNLFGVPTEAFGFSNNPGLTIGEPAIKKLLFPVKGETRIQINTRTLF